ncbi:MAG TPA: hypothetical protein VHX11_09160 [Acidobacteriaceae bacterium]|nr:hypothetical protein [Acidobacteriaceae bacterium]
MSTPSLTPGNAAGGLYNLLPAVFRTRDAQQGGQLQAFFAVLESQLDLVRNNAWQLYDDQFIETCAPWAIPYIGALIGFDPIYTVALTGPDSRAEVANTIGYRRRKGTLLAMEQLTRDVSGRMTIVVEEFKHLVTNLSLRDVRAHHADTANFRRGRDWDEIEGPFARLNRTVDVRRIAPRNRVAPAAPDPTPLDITLHGPGRYNVPDIAIWMWRWQSWQLAEAPAFALGNSGYFFSTLGAPTPLFQQPPPAPAPFARLMTEADTPQPITRERFARNIAAFYPSSIALLADGEAVDASQIVCANLVETAGQLCTVPAGKIAIDPELGRIQFAADMALPADLQVTYSYGSPAQIGGGSYDRSANLALPAGSGIFNAIVGSAAFPTLASAVAAWNALPAGSAGVIVLPNYDSLAVDLTGSNAIAISAESQLVIAAAKVSEQGAPPEWNHSRVTLNGQIEIYGLPSPPLAGGEAAPMGQVMFSGILLAGAMSITGDAICVQIADCTLTPGRTLTGDGNPASPGEPSLWGTAIGSCLSITRSISGPIALAASCSARILNSILDAGSPFCPAFAGPDLASAGAALHIEDSTVIGRIWAQTIPLASNTIFHARLGKRDPWKAPVWANQLQSGCIRFCWLPCKSIVPRRYECLPPDAASEPALLPQFITLRFGDPGYCLLSGYVPLAIWTGADNGSQMGVYQQIQETEAVANIQIRSAEYLPANLEAGVFLVPWAERYRAVPGMEPYGYGMRTTPKKNRCLGEDSHDQTPIGIGIGLL